MPLRPVALRPDASVSMSTIQSGTVATKSAAKLDGIYCTAHTTPPLPPTSKKRPTTTALRRSKDVGAGSPLSRRQKYKNPPEIVNRAAADRNGGMVSTANRIAR